MYGIRPYPFHDASLQSRVGILNQLFSNMAYDVAYDMTSVVEAASLSSVTAIAADPPAHPGQLPETNNLPLTLYIARVPGSRDVFLTPVKPREKVVTAYDVTNALYFLHFNTEDDYGTDSLVIQKPSSADTDVSQLSGVYSMGKVPPALPTRRPVQHSSPAPPVSPPYPVDDPLPTYDARPPSPPKHHGISRKPVVREATNISSSRDPAAFLPVLHRRPLPSPPEERPTSMHEDNIRLLRRSETSDETNPYSRNYDTHPETLKQLELDARPTAGSLTLIRRDLGSSEQWNVAIIHDPPIHEVSSTSLLAPTATRRTKKGGSPLYLDITNPGYAQFLSTSRPVSRNSTSTATSTDSSDLPPAQGLFRRRLYMPGSKYADHGYSSTGHRKHLSTASIPTQDTMRRSLQSDRHHSFDSSAMASADHRSKGYAFASPWDGTCEFTTGATGKSLKCRHRLPKNPSAQEVSELRFNLPTSSSSSTPLKQKRSSYFVGRSRPAADEDGATPSIMINEDTGRIDLSLGQERAGGGFGGKQAKLGKLIVWPEGLGMLDLLVTANLGLWWRAYEKGG